MADRTADLFAAVFAALDGNAALVALVGQDSDGFNRIYTTPPQGAVAPYVVIGEQTASDYGSSAGDAQTHSLTLHVWTDGSSAAQSCLTIMAALRDVLHGADLALSTGHLVYLRQEWSETMQDPDGVSQHGIMRYRALTEN